MKFAHIADTHIRNLKYHQEYRAVFDKIYDSLRKEEVDYIIHCGDICHTKTQISPEFVQMCSDFFKNLADIAPTYIILGNHDGNLRNPNRQDSLSPIANTLNHPNLHLLKNSGEVNLDNNFTLNVLSVFDEDNWTDPTDKDKINIALYHGSISGCTTDSDWVMDVGENDIDIFNKFDYAMLGDIHKTNQTLDPDGRIRYVGSTIQQNFGETTSKGFLLWKIQSKETFTVEHVPIVNPKPFISITLTKNGKVPKMMVPEGARVRLIVENSLSGMALKKAVDVAKKKFNPESVSVMNKSSFTNNVELEDGFKKENLRDITVQEKLIRQYLKDYDPNKDLEKRIMDLNRKYKESSEEDDEAYRHIDYEILEFEWSNLINYGKGNRINFMDFNGIVGIFGKNFSGKSSIIDSLLFTIYNSISKNSRKNLNIINNDKTEGWGRVKIKRGNKIYTIKRDALKYLKKLKGEETIEAKTIVDFACIDIVTGKKKSLNGLTRADTDKNISKYFGTLDDFLLTSMSSQLGALTFIDEGSTKRKEILAKFLDLKIFDKKFKSAKDDAAELKAALKFLQKIDYEEDLKKFNQEMEVNENVTITRSNQCAALKESIAAVEDEIGTFQDKISAAPTELININEIKAAIGENEKTTLLYDEQLNERKKKNRTNKRKVRKAKEFIEKFDIDTLKNQKQSHSAYSTDFERLTIESNANQLNIQNKKKQVSLLKEVPCGSEFSHCKFIRGAYEAKEQINIIELAINNNKEIQKVIKEKVGEIDLEKVNNEINKFDDLVEEAKRIDDTIPANELLIENLKSKKAIAKHELKELQSKEKLYEENKEVIEDLGGVIRQRREKEKEFLKQKSDLKFCEEQLLTLHKRHGYCEQKIENLEAEKKRHKQLQDDYEAHDLYMKCMHPNGISYDIIKKSLPVINAEISKILANIVDFQVYFETDDNRLDIYIQHPDQDASPLEMASGAEKTVAAMAIRLAFTNISSLPKSQLFVLDEPGTSLDAERMEGFVRILDITSSIFKTVILISHLDSLKDAADSIINIEKKNGYANVVA